MAPSSDDVQANSGRALRRTSRVNYTEEHINSAFNSASSQENPPPPLSKSNGNPSAPSLKNPKSTSSSPPTSLPSSKREREKESLDANNSIPLNWQPPASPNEIFNNMLNLQGAYVDDDSSLHLTDGTVYSPEGNFFLKFFLSRHF